MNGEITCGMMRENELRQVGALFSASWRRTYPGMVPDEFLARLSPDRACEMWSEYLEIPGNFIMVARSAENVVGMVAAQPGYDLFEAGYVAALHVAAGFKGNGTGKKLLGVAARYLQGQGVNRLALAVIEGNNAALAIYRHLGAKIVGRRKTDEGFISSDYILLFENTANLCLF